MSAALIADAVRRLAAAGVDNPRLDARVLWEHAILPLKGGGGEQSEPEGVMTPPRSAPRFDPPLAGEGMKYVARFASFLARRIAREPLAYITGRKEFWSLTFEVGPGVLIPRPETETIIEQALAALPDRQAPLKVLDLGTGSGCLLVTLLKEFPNSHGLGIDSSREALGYASRNLACHGLQGRGEVRLGNWGDEIGGPWDVIVANPPYIKTGEITGLAPEVSRHEPVRALDGGADGLDAIRRVAEEMARLRGALGLTEIGAGQAAEARIIMAQTGLTVVRTAADLAGIPRVLVSIPHT